MCSRFELKSGRQAIIEAFGLVECPAEIPDGQRRPTDPALVVGMGKAGLIGVVRRFGIPAPWDTAKPLFNARSETLDSKPTFRPFLEKRCIVPATGYFEWRQDADGRKHLNRIGPADGGLFAFAALSDSRNFVIITCPPAASIAHIHGRMPVILDRDGVENWLDRSLPFISLRSLFHAPPDEALATEEDPPEKRR